MYDRILYPTDGSEGAEAALEHAIDHAVTYDASLHALYVVEDTFPEEVEEVPDVLAALEEAGRRTIDEVRDRAKDAGVGTIQASVVVGPPHEQILLYAEEKEVDLIVMGTEGRGEAEQSLLGSVTERVVRAAEPPVLTVSPTDDR